MNLPYSDPSNPALPSPLFSDLAAVRNDHMRANNNAIFTNLEFLNDNNPEIVALTGGSFKTSALANADTYNGRSTFTCTGSVTDTPYSGAWRIAGLWNPTDSSGRFIAMLDTSLETWEINYSGGAWGTWTKHTDSSGNQFANAFVSAYNTTATSGGTLTLTVASAPNQFFTGSSDHTVTLPVVSTLQQGFTFFITNTSTGVVTVNSSGGNLVATVPPQATRQFMCILITGTDAASWFVSYDEIPVGHEMDWSGLSLPANYIARDGSSLARASYPALFAALCGVTIAISNISIGSAAVFTSNGHGLSTFQCVSFEGTTPTGVTAGLSYYVIVINADTFRISTTMANAIAGTYVTTSGSYSNVFLRKSSWGTADINHFYLPDDRGIHSVGAGIQGTATGWSGSVANHFGIIGYYEEDKDQRVQGTLTFGVGLLGSGSGAFSANTNANTWQGSTAGVNKIGVFDNATVIRAGTISNPARVGKLKIIKYR